MEFEDLEFFGEGCVERFFGRCWDIFWGIYIVVSFRVIELNLGNLVLDGIGFIEFIELREK